MDQETGLKLQAALHPLAKPHPKSDHGSVDGRSPAERNGDAFADLLQMAMSSGQLPTEGGEPVTVFVTTDIDTLRTGIGTATTLDGHTIPVEQVQRTACDAGIIPTLLGSHGEILDTGCRDRTTPPKLRRRLILRDRGCAHPDCDTPPTQCHAYHIQHWTDGGLTVENNMVLLRPHHHRQIHHTPWQTHINPTTKLPEFTPPPHHTRTNRRICRRTPELRKALSRSAG